MKYYGLIFIQFFYLILLSACAKDDSSNVLLSTSSAFADKIKRTDIISKAFIIAHGGYWDSVNPFNSLSSMKRALMLDIYGTEIDIHLPSALRHLIFRVIRSIRVRLNTFRVFCDFRETILKFSNS